LDGIALASVQALYQMSVELEKKTAVLKEEVKAFRVENAELKARLGALERRLGGYAMK